MKKLLFHVSSSRYDVLEPIAKDNYEECICFSTDSFISYFGQYLYIFDYETLSNDFYIKEKYTEGVCCGFHQGLTKYRFVGKPLGNEYRIYEPIDVDKYCIGIAEHWNYAVGQIEKVVKDKIVEKERVDFINQMRA